MKFVFVLLCMQIASALSAPANRSFDIVYLNLERHKEKRAHVERMLEYANCSFRRFSAVDGRELHAKNKSIEDYADGVPIVPTSSSLHRRISADNAGRAGCHLSHLIVLRGIDASGEDRPVLILEDDIDLDERFAEKVEEVLASPPERWGVILLGGIFASSWWGHPSSKHLVAGQYSACLHAYLVNGAESARRIADVIDTARCPGRPVDLIIADAFRGDPTFKFYCFSPMTAIQRRDLFKSSISMPVPFYEKLLGYLFPSPYLKPLEHSLSRASSRARSGAGRRAGAAQSWASIGLLLCAMS